VTIALLAALGHEKELALHGCATRNTGASPEDILEALPSIIAVYADVPVANSAVRTAKEIFARLD